MAKKDPEEAYRSLFAESRNECQTYSKIEQIRIGVALFHLLPTVKAEDYPQFISKLHLNQRYSAMEMNYVSELAPRLDLDRSVSQRAILGERGVFCSFHAGSYRLIVPWLVSAGLKITMLIDAKVNAVIGQLIEKSAREFLTQRGMDTDRLRVRDTAMPGVLRKIIRDSSEGYSPFVYVDGNLSLEAGEKSNSVFDFLGGRISVKSGAAQLSKILRLPLFVAIASSRPEPPAGPSSSFFIKQVPEAETESLTVTMRQVWRSLEERLLAEPADWESWRYIDRSLILDMQSKVDAKPTATTRQPARREQLVLNQNRYALERVGEKLVLFDRKTIVAHFISLPFFEFLERVRSRRPFDQHNVLGDINEGTIASLRLREILIIDGSVT
jgi:KDO2-lipid IV(A) lauroyltransferase